MAAADLCSIIVVIVVVVAPARVPASRRLAALAVEAIAWLLSTGILCEPARLFLPLMGAEYPMTTSHDP